MARLIPADGGEVREIAGPLKLEAMQELVGGFIEVVSLAFEGRVRIALVIDEEGKLKGKPVNIMATALWHSRKPAARGIDVIVGDALLVRIEDEGVDGKERWL